VRLSTCVAWRYWVRMLQRKGQPTTKFESVEAMNSSPTNVASSALLAEKASRRQHVVFALQGECARGAGSAGAPVGGVSHPTVEISPANVVTRQSLTGDGVTVESVNQMGPGTVIHRFCAPRHLLVAYEQGERTRGESFVEGAPSSKMRTLARRLTFVPAGHEYREEYEPRTATRVAFLYFDPHLLRAASDTRVSDYSLGPRLLFEDLPLWHLMMRLKGLLDEAFCVDRRYFEAIGIVLVQELVRSGPGVRVVQPSLRGGLAGWQQRAVATYIQENFAKRIPLATMARLVRLSPCHFCRAFKQSFGMPPHRYQIERRIEHAKRLLAKRELSVTEIGLEIGFASFSAFVTTFRKATGFSPRAYARSL
jgi:AraC family transcriptional regulator